MSRNEAIATIKTALKRRSGKAWSVTGGRGTAWGWITIDVPPARRGYAFDGITPDHDSFAHASLAEREELAQLLGLSSPVHAQGVKIPAGLDYYQEYSERAEGKPITRQGTQYWD